VEQAPDRVVDRGLVPLAAALQSGPSPFLRPMNAPEALPHSAAGRLAAARQFGRFELQELVGRSRRLMAWRAFDPRVAQQLVLVLPRLAPADAAAFDRWERRARRAARLDHPHLAHAVEVGAVERWPFVAYDIPLETPTLADRLAGGEGLAPRDAAQAALQMAQGLAYAHEAGVVHGDLQAFLACAAEGTPVRLLGLEVAPDDALGAAEGVGAGAAAAVLGEADRLRVQREGARRDVLMLGLVLHQLLVGRPALDERDNGRLADRLPPHGREIVRLPWALPRPIPDPLRAIVNRATERQERQRYRAARTLGGALDGWLRSDVESGGGPLALLADRLHSVGVLPALPGAAERAARLALMERERTNELAEVVRHDLALAFELLRTVNTASVRGAQIAGSGPVLTIRRAIALVGLDGVRHASLRLRPWPGPLDERGAADLHKLIARAKRAGRIAQALRPPGYDAEVVYLLTLLQNLGRLVLQYHFPEEARQIRALMQAVAPAEPGQAEEPGMSEEAASFAVLGVDTEAVGAAVARHWGLDDSVLHMIRRLPDSTAVHDPDGDDDMLRIVASCANEAVDALRLPAARAGRVLDRVALRYGRVLDITPRDLKAAMQPGAVGRADQAVEGPATDAPTEGTTIL
jgi:non-specific serine/threonine protein kinase